MELNLMALMVFETFYQFSTKCRESQCYPASLFFKYWCQCKTLVIMKIYSWVTCTREKSHISYGRTLSLVSCLWWGCRDQHAEEIRFPLISEHAGTFFFFCLNLTKKKTQPGVSTSSYENGRALPVAQVRQPHLKPLEPGQVPRYFQGNYHLLLSLYVCLFGVFQLLTK